jgi:hypothetical protein
MFQRELWKSVRDSSCQVVDIMLLWSSCLLHPDTKQRLSALTLSPHVGYDCIANHFFPPKSMHSLQCVRQ